MKHTFVGFGFGPIQSGLFVVEAFNSGNFERIVIAEIDQSLVDAIRSNNGIYYVNIASPTGIETVGVDDIEIYNPSVDEDRDKLIEALSKATEIATSLPSVNFFDTGQNSVASLIRQGLQKSTADATIIYTAENNNHAAEVLEEKVNYKPAHPVQYLNTVIGKMSQVVTDADIVEAKKLVKMAPGIARAFLVEEFNKILVTKCNITGFTPGIEAFDQKTDLMPFEEAKLHGHNAIHFLLAALGAYKGYVHMKDLSLDKKIMRIAADAFIKESGVALIKKYNHLQDELFTESGYRAYAEDLLGRMTNPYLDDPIGRIARDPIRKLGCNDRIFGTIRLALEYGIEPTNMAIGAAAAVEYLLKNAKQNDLPVDFHSISSNQSDAERIEKLLRWMWKSANGRDDDKLIKLSQRGMNCLRELL